MPIPFSRRFTASVSFACEPQGISPVSLTVADPACIGCTAGAPRVLHDMPVRPAGALPQ